MKILILGLLILTSCATTTPSSPEEQICRDTCSEQNLKFWAVGTEGACECIEKIQREFHNRE